MKFQKLLPWILLAIITIQEYCLWSRRIETAQPCGVLCPTQSVPTKLPRTRRAHLRRKLLSAGEPFAWSEREAKQKLIVSLDTGDYARPSKKFPSIFNRFYELCGAYLTDQEMATLEPKLTKFEREKPSLYLTWSDDIDQDDADAVMTTTLGKDRYSQVRAACEHAEDGIEIKHSHLIAGFLQNELELSDSQRNELEKIGLAHVHRSKNWTITNNNTEINMESQNTNDALDASELAQIQQLLTPAQWESYKQIISDEEYQNLNSVNDYLPDLPTQEKVDSDGATP